jgi:polysaccharide export outer membrane protein
MLRTLNTIIIICLCIIGLSSCTNTRKATYFYNVPDTTFAQGGPDISVPIEPNDILLITISSLDPSSTAIFNPPNNNIAKATTVTGSTTEPGGYLVSSDGTIQLPVLGTMKVAGLTKKEIKDNITNMILSKKLLVDPLVEVRFLNFEVTVLGEVAKPTVITVPSEKISLLKALGLAGDLTIYGRRDNVLLIREENGKKKTRHIDLNSDNFFNSPYYYLQPNDVVYVQPNKARVAAAGRTQQLLPILLGGLSILVIVLNSVKF